MSQSTFVKSTIILTIATLLSKVLGSVFRIPLQNIAGDEVLGIFNLVYPVYMVALYLSVAGIPLAISKLIAEAHAKQEPFKVKKIYMTSSILAICFGILSFSVIFGLSDLLAGWLGGPSTKLALIVVACTLLVAPYMAVYRGFFQGHGNMQPTAVSQVLEQLIRAVLIIVLAFVLVKMDYSTEVVAGGVMAGSIIGALASLLYLRLKYAKSDMKIKDSAPYSRKDFSSYTKTILIISIPIAIGSVTMALMNFIDSFTISYGLRATGITDKEINYLYGVYGRGITLIQIVTVFASSIILPLVPLITKKLAEKDMAGTSRVVTDAHKMTHLISWPAALGLFALTLPLNLALFTNVEGSSMMAILNVSAVFTSLTLLGTGVLQGLNLARVGAYIVIGAVVVKIFTNIFFIQWFGLDGAAWSTLLVYALIFVGNSVVIFRSIPYKAVSGAIVKIVFAAVVMAAVVGLPTLYFDMAQWSRLVALSYVFVGMGVGTVVYFALLWVSKAVNADDLAKLPVIGRKFNGSAVKATPPAGNDNGNSPRSGKKGKFMRNKIVIWAVIVLLLAASSVSLVSRWKAEENNKTFEIMIPYFEVEETAKEMGVEVDEVLVTLKDAGLTSISISPFTLDSLEKDGQISLFKDYELVQQLQFTPYRDQVNVNEKGFYITAPTNESVLAMLQKAFEMEKRVIADEDFYFISSEGLDYTEKTSIGFDEEIIEKVRDAGFLMNLRVENDKSIYVNTAIVSQILNMDTTNIVGLLPSGAKAEWIGLTDGELLNWMHVFYDKDLTYYKIEGNAVKGEVSAFRENGYDLIRLISLNPRLEAGLTVSKSVERTVRAVKERNIRSVMYHIPNQATAEKNLQDTLAYLKDVQEATPSQFALGEPVTYDKVNVPSWAVLVAALAGVLFIFLAGEMWGNRILQGLGALFMLVLACGYFVLDKLVFIQGFALIVAVVTPIYAIVRSARGSTNIGKILLQYVKAIGISAVGIWIVVAILNGNGFITGVEGFRGVKLVYIVPIVGALIFALLIYSGLFEKGLKGALSNGVKLFNLEVRYWHIIVLVVIAAVGVFYMMRTGNSGVAPAWEIAFRTWLENVMYVRPRTKEFLIAFPIFVLALYVMGINRKWGSLLLVPSAIGFLSIMNTFTHFHIPLGLSILRTVYGASIGFVVGLLFIVAFVVLKKLVVKFVAVAKERWL